MSAIKVSAGSLLIVVDQTVSSSASSSGNLIIVMKPCAVLLGRAHQEFTLESTFERLDVA